jgi:ABC-2 type transport system permease protein
MRMLTWRAMFFAELLLNTMFIIILYYFWKAVYFQDQVINGMTFEQAFSYIVIASLITTSINTLVEVRVAHLISSGDIVYVLIRPLNFQLRLLVESIGGVIVSLLTYTIPVFTVFLLIFKPEIQFGINLPFFLVSLVFSFLINYAISFVFGMLGMYTQASWGISFFKGFIVSFFSGALIPLNFFHGVLQKITFVLPFHTIIHTPLKLLLATDFSGAEAFNYLIQQALWAGVFLVVNLFLYNKLNTKLIVNGG